METKKKAPTSAAKKTTAHKTDKTIGKKISTSSMSGSASSRMKSTLSEKSAANKRHDDDYDDYIVVETFEVTEF